MGGKGCKHGLLIDWPCLVSVDMLTYTDLQFLYIILLPPIFPMYTLLCGCGPSLQVASTHPFLLHCIRSNLFFIILSSLNLSINGREMMVVQVQEANWQVKVQTPSHILYSYRNKVWDPKKEIIHFGRIFQAEFRFVVCISQI